MLVRMVCQEAQPPVLATEKLATGALDGLSSTTSTMPLIPPAAPEATRASNTAGRSGWCVRGATTGWDGGARPALAGDAGGTPVSCFGGAAGVRCSARPRPAPAPIAAPAAGGCGW